MQNEKGFSLIEALVTASVFFIVLAGVYLMVFHYAEVSRTEQSRRRMQQESRFLTSHFTAELKNAGAVLTLADSSSFLKGIPYFNGIYPLNSYGYDYYPDGIIIASGDPDAVTHLTRNYVPGTNAMYVDDTITFKYDSDVGDTYQTGQWKDWRKGDKGILLNRDGYYIFLVDEVPDSGTLAVRPVPVYFSGLLFTYPDLEKQKLYVDDIVTNNPDDPETKLMGNEITYPGDPDKKEGATPVIRLASFSIYMFREERDRRYDTSIRKIRQLIRVTDAKGDPDVLSINSLAKKSIISEKIWDMQIAYSAYGQDQLFDGATPDTSVDIVTQYFGSLYPTSPYEMLDLVRDLRYKWFKKLNITIVSLSDEFGGKGEVRHKVPAIADQYEYYLHPGKYSYKILSLEIEPRSYNIKKFL